MTEFSITQCSWILGFMNKWWYYKLSYYVLYVLYMRLCVLWYIYIYIYIYIWYYIYYNWWYYMLYMLYIDDIICYSFIFGCIINFWHSLLIFQDQTERAFRLFQQLLKADPDFKKAKEAYRVSFEWLTFILFYILNQVLVFK